MAKRVFITRHLSPVSSFLLLLSEAGMDVEGFSLLEFTPIKFTSPLSADWVFFYSARSVDFFLNGLHRLGLRPDHYQHYAAMGYGTAAALADHGITPDFVGTGKPEETAKAFLKMARGERVLFPRARQSRQSIQRFLKDKVAMIDLVVYQNEIAADLRIPASDYVVFTSPLNVSAYFGACKPGKETRLLAIGNTTAKALEEQGISKFRVAKQPGEVSLAQTILEWENV